MCGHYRVQARVSCGGGGTIRVQSRVSCGIAIGTSLGYRVGIAIGSNWDLMMYDHCMVQSNVS